VEGKGPMPTAHKLICEKWHLPSSFPKWLHSQGSLVTSNRSQFWSTINRNLLMASGKLWQYSQKERIQSALEF
jgi:hypothetical protein